MASIDWFERGDLRVPVPQALPEPTQIERGLERVRVDLQFAFVLGFGRLPILARLSDEREVEGCASRTSELHLEGRLISRSAVGWVAPVERQDSEGDPRQSDFGVDPQRFAKPALGRRAVTPVEHDLSHLVVHV